jgi:hypothetical protein
MAFVNDVIQRYVEALVDKPTLERILWMSFKGVVSTEVPTFMVAPSIATPVILPLTVVY